MAGKNVVNVLPAFALRVMAVKNVVNRANDEWIRRASYFRGAKLIWFAGSAVGSTAFSHHFCNSERFKTDFFTFFKNS